MASKGGMRRGGIKTSVMFAAAIGAWKRPARASPALQLYIKQSRVSLFLSVCEFVSGSVCKCVCV